MWEFLGVFFSYDDMICGALIVARARAGCCDAAAWGAPRSAGLSAAVSLLLSRLSLPRYPKAMKPPIKPPPSEMPARAPSESAVAPESAVASERAAERRWVGFNPWVGSPPPPHNSPLLSATMNSCVGSRRGIGITSGISKLRGNSGKAGSWSLCAADGARMSSHSSLTAKRETGGGALRCSSVGSCVQ